MEIIPWYGLLNVKAIMQIGIRTVAVAIDIATIKAFGFAT
jgi:hypothetical protein